MKKVLVKILDAVLIYVLWICHIIYNNLFTKTKNDTTKLVPSSSSPSNNEQCEKRHFIHLYHTTSSAGHPECYMDVYELFSPSDEKMLRAVCAKGVPNSTYWRYKKGLDYQQKNYMPKTVVECSAMVF